jgi:hypothetical protein
MIHPQVQTRSADGQLYAVARSYTRRRRLKLDFFGEQESDKDEIRDSILEPSDWGEQSLVIVPDSNDEIVVHGRVTDRWGYRRVAGQSGGFYKYSLIVEEDPFELEFQ